MTYYVEIWDTVVPERYNGLKQVGIKDRLDIISYTDLVTTSKTHAFDRKAELWARGQSARIVDYLGYRLDQE